MVKGTLFAFMSGLALLMALIVSSCSVSTESEDLVFEVDRFSIHGDLQKPDGVGPHPAIIIVHGDGRGTHKYYRTMRRSFIDAGYAVLIWDKPGFGKSSGEFSVGQTLSERADILLEAVATLRSKSEIDPDRIGVWGVSQAGYVIPLAIQRGADVTFMILVGAPGENSVQQTAYFVGQQILCEGYSQAQVAEADSLAVGVMSARTHEEYAEYGQLLLEQYPEVKHFGFMAGILSEDRWSPRDPDSEAFFDPMPIFEMVDVPILVFFGELDKNIDPVQGSAAFGAAINKVGNKYSKVVLLSGVDHDMVPSETGCMKERNRRRVWRASSKYIDAMYLWLIEIRDTDGLK